MKTKTLKLALNIGDADRDRLKIQGDGKEGDIVTVDEKVADAMLQRGWAVLAGSETGTPGLAAAGAEFPTTVNPGDPVAPTPKPTGKADEKKGASPIPADRRQAPGGTGL